LTGHIFSRFLTFLYGAVPVRSGQRIDNKAEGPDCENQGQQRPDPVLGDQGQPERGQGKPGAVGGEGDKFHNRHRQGDNCTDGGDQVGAGLPDHHPPAGTEETIDKPGGGEEFPDGPAEPVPGNRPLPDPPGKPEIFPAEEQLTGGEQYHGPHQGRYPGDITHDRGQGDQAGQQKNGGEGTSSDRVQDLPQGDCFFFGGCPFEQSKQFFQVSRSAGCVHPSFSRLQGIRLIPADRLGIIFRG